MFVNLNDYSFSVPQNPRSLEQILSKYLESLNRQAGNLPFCMLQRAFFIHKIEILSFRLNTELGLRLASMILIRKLVRIIYIFVLCLWWFSGQRKKNKKRALFKLDMFILNFSCSLSGLPVYICHSPPFQVNVDTFQFLSPFHWYFSVFCTTSILSRLLLT